MVYDTYRTEDATYYIADSLNIPDLPNRYVIITERQVYCQPMRCDECIFNDSDNCAYMASVLDAIRQYFPTFCTTYPELLI